MEISELRDGMRRVEAEGMVTAISDSRSVDLKIGGTARVADVDFEDASKKIKLVLWDDRINMIKVGHKYRVENGYTNSFRGELRLNVGRYGKLIPLAEGA